MRACLQVAHRPEYGHFTGLLQEPDMRLVYSLGTIPKVEIP